jgi:uncharacterized protein YuzE
MNRFAYNGSVVVSPRPEGVAELKPSPLQSARIGLHGLKAVAEELIPMEAKEKVTLGLELSINEQTGKPRAAYLQVRTGDAAETREIAPDKAYADYDSEGRLLGVEFLAPCAVTVVDQFTVDQPANVREFLRSVQPRELLVN